MKTVALLFAVGGVRRPRGDRRAGRFVERIQQRRRGPDRQHVEGPDRQPPLTWTGAPAQTKAYAVIVDDPDAPAKTWVRLVAMTTGASADGPR